MSKDVERVFGHPTKGMFNGQLNVLAQMWRKYAFKMNLTPSDFTRFMEQWLADPLNRVPRQGKERSSYRGNMVKQLTKESLTISNFLTGIRFTKPQSAKIIIEIVDQKGQQHVIVQPIVLSKEEAENLRLNPGTDPLNGMLDSIQGISDDMHRRMEENDWEEPLDDDD